MTTREKLLAMLGESPSQIVRDLEAFSASARVLSSDHPRLIEAHPQQWVGIFNGKVEVAGKTIKSVLAQADAKGLPHDKIIVRFIDRNETTLIL